MRRVRIAIAGAALACAPRTMNGPPVAPPARPSHVFALPGGTRLLVLEDHATTSVLVSLVVAGGSRHDPRGKEGLAHLVEHLSYRARTDAGRRVDVVKGAGGDFNAWTRDEETQFVTIAPREALGSLLALEASRLQDPLAGVDEQTLRVEREVIRNEIRSRGLDAAAAELLKEMLFPPDHPYRHAGVTTHASLDAVTLDDVRTFASERYRAGSASITVSGDVDAADVRAKLTALLPAEISLAPQADRVPSRPPKPHEQGMRRIEGPVVTSTVVLGWALPGGFDRDEVQMAIILPALRGAATSFLSHQRVESARCVAAPGARIALVLCTIELVEGEDPTVIAEKAVDGIYLLWSDDANAKRWRTKAFAQARAEFAAEQLRRAGSVHLGETIARDFHHGVIADRTRRMLRTLEQTDDLALQRFAYRALNRSHVVTFAVDPLPPDAPRSVVAVDPTYSWPGAIVESAVDAPRDPESIAALAKAPDLSGLVDETLPNGLRAIVLPRRGTGTVRVALFARGGPASADPWGLPELAFAKHSARDPLAFGGVWTTTRYPDAQLLSIDAPSARLSDALATLHERVRTTRSGWDQRQFERAIESIRRRTKAAEKRPETDAWRALWGALLGKHPAGSGGFDVVRLAALERADYDRWISRHLAPKNSTLLVVGDVAPADVQERLGDWRQWRARDPGEALPLFPPPPPPPAPRLFLAERGSGFQADLTLACEAGADAAPLEVLTALLREELWSALRDASGAAYGVEVAAARHPTQGGPFAILTIRAQVQADRAPAAAKLLLDRVRNAASVDEDRLARTKAVLARRTHVENLSAPELAESLAATLRTGGAPADLAARPHALANVSRESLARILVPCAHHEIVSVVGPAELAKPLEITGLPLDLVGHHVLR